MGVKITFFIEILRRTKIRFLSDGLIPADSEKCARFLRKDPFCVQKSRSSIDSGAYHGDRISLKRPGILQDDHNLNNLEPPGDENLETRLKISFYI